MPIVFKYKNPVNFSYAPGRTNIGQDGDVGSPGSQGNSLYFTDLELDNTYNIELTLQKIENNTVLSSVSTGSISNIREYKINDLILSRSGKCYKLIESNSSSLFKNYKYDIELVGEFNKKSSASAVKVVFERVKTSGISKNPVPTNRCIEKNSYTAADYNLRCLMYNVYLYGTEYSPDSFYSTPIDALPSSTSEKEIQDRKAAIDSISKGDYTPYRYSVQIKLKTNKQFYYNLSPVEIENIIDAKLDNTLLMPMYKTLEIPNVDLMKDDFYKNTESDNDHLEKYCAPAVFTVSDSMLDRFHPEGNNVACTISSSKDMWYKTGLRAGDGAFTGDSFELSETEKLNSNNCVSTSEKYGNSGIFVEAKTRTFTEDDDAIPVDFSNPAKNLPKYTTASANPDADGTSLQFKMNAASVNHIEGQLSNKDSKLLLADRKTLPGTSVYFSSISNNDECMNVMQQFLFSPNTVVYVIIKNLRTKEISISEVPFEIV